MDLGKRSLKFWVGIGVGVVAVSGIGIASASIPDSSGVIHGCYNRNGLLRVIDTAGATTNRSQCKTTESPISWNAQGSIGPTGPRGPDSLPPQGQFTPTQIVHTAILTCTGTSTTASTATCTGMKLNGLDVTLSPTAANAICNAVTGKGYNTANGVGVASAPYFTWNGSNWAVVSSGSTSPMQNLTCNT